jgi:hypothetical protein
MANFSSCNILHLGTDRRSLWRFSVSGGDARLDADLRGTLEEPLPVKLVRKNWITLFQKKLNIAWLPPEQVFLRVVQLPKCDPAELPAMVEFQLEKLSPLPVAQIVWSVASVPNHSTVPSELQTVLVVIVAREFVEEFMGNLETRGYLADQLEVPFLHELLATKVDADGVWIFPRSSGTHTLCLTAWWYSGVLQNLSMLHLTSPDNLRSELGEQLTKTAWAGELEGWLTQPPVFRIVANEATAAVWQPAMNEWAGGEVAVVKPLEAPALATASARRAARNGASLSLVPPEFTARYQQQLVDGVWMRGLGTLLVIYLLGVAVYFAALFSQQYKQKTLEDQIARLAVDFTRSQQLKARVLVVREQVNLKFAALDCWRLVTESLPTELTLKGMTFSRGRTLTLQGVSSDAARVTDYNEALTKITVSDGLLFSRVEPGSTRTGPGELGPQTTFWSFNCELRRLDNE